MPQIMADRIIIDKTSPKCPQPIFPVRMEDALIQVPAGLASHAPDVFDEFECLNLNITAPAGSNETSQFPVLIYIHGGGAFSGANSDWWCDGGSIVAESIKLEKPIVMVAINYRLGPLGYIGSNELRQELGKENAGNYGLRDIVLLPEAFHLAISWVSKYIAPFGGSQNITISGESAGSLTVESQIHSLLPAHFTRAIMQSQNLGQVMFSIPQSLEAKSELYQNTKDQLGVHTVKELQEVPWDKYIDAYRAIDPRPGLGELVTIDDEFFSSSWRTTFSFANNPEAEALVGNTGREGSVIEFLSVQASKPESRPTFEALTTTLSGIMPRSQVDEILQAYKITPDSSVEDASTKLLDIIEDLIFYKGAFEFATLAREAGIPVREYGFQQGNPFPGMFKDVSTHSLDLAYLHGDPKIFGGTESPEGEWKVQREMQRGWIEFAYGEKTGVGRDKVLVVGPGGEGGLRGREWFFEELRRGAAWGVWEGLGEQQMTALTGVVLGHYAGLVGRG
ncbi:carboxylesterase protein [Rutstroemia sp. NJR-2017a BBW]|nr:carboxylesterase protein [Rutstroemia sp. NJR-2017a BBW]